ncbi:MAG: hypothetical protein K8S97_15275, partial [Anaerolineae bacterium]|nr:hypothetical protein [Anaerolineae bacterium]
MPALHIPPPPITTRTGTPTPRFRSLLLNTPLETAYVPDDVWERYTFTSDDALRVGLTITAADAEGALSLYAQVYAAGGTLISQVALFDDPLLSGVWDLPGPGDYTLYLYGPETRPRRVTLTLRALPVPASGGGDIVYGQTRSGALRVAGQRDIWTFEGIAGERVGI